MQQNDFKVGLEALSPEEVKILDDVIDNNPQFYAIVQKAWPFIAEAFKPFVENGMDGDADEMGAAAQPAPSPMPMQPQIQPEIRGPQSVLAGNQFRR